MNPNVLRGVCWGTSSGPGIDKSRTADGSGEGILSAQLRD